MAMKSFIAFNSEKLGRTMITKEFAATIGTRVLRSASVKVGSAEHSIYPIALGLLESVISIMSRGDSESVAESYVTFEGPIVSPTLCDLYHGRS